jgi:hypothetical protein
VAHIFLTYRKCAALLKVLSEEVGPKGETDTAPKLFQVYSLIALKMWFAFGIVSAVPLLLELCNAVVVVNIVPKVRVYDNRNGISST